MQFYRITGKRTRNENKNTEILQENAEQETAHGPEEMMEDTARRGRRLRRESQDNDWKQDIREITERFNANDVEKGSAVFFSNCSMGNFTLGAVAGSFEECRKMVEKFNLAQNQGMGEATFEEVTLEGFMKLCQYGSRRGFINDDDEVLEALDLEKLVHIGRYGLEAGENLLKERKRKDLIKEAEKLMVEESLLPEMERISAAAVGKKRVCGHPVHYLVKSDDKDIRRETYQILLSSLYAGGRIRNRRYVYTDFHGGQNFSEHVLDELFASCKGGAFVIRYRPAEEMEEGEYASEERETIETLAGIISRYRHEVLTVLCLPRECTKTWELFKEFFPRVSMVEISEELVSGEKAKKYLRRLCSGRGVSADKKLLVKTEGEKCFLAGELRALFEEWFDRKLKMECYPQYREMNSVMEGTAKEKPKGNAYNELMEMIGLASAKKVMNDALDYFKAQKVFAGKGMELDRPSMHMVFTGNPGTAKTTCARLFARIMKENGVLSKGHLVECGRGDLVGKYVGHTAPTIQKKFSEAKGGVLFIDEAYSLVDDRSGSFGDEAINTIVAEMENHREDTVVIFAGYPEQMEGFLEKNPGLRSRVVFHVNFEDYKAEELVKIAELIAKQKGLELSPGAKKQLLVICIEAVRQEDFGNGRYVRNLIEKAKMKQASRLLKMDLDAITPEDIRMISEDDIEIPETGVKETEKKVMGFHVA